MRRASDTVRAAAAIAPALFLLVAAVLVSDQRVSSLLNVAALIFLAVMVIETVLGYGKQDRDRAGDGGTSIRPGGEKRLLRLLSFIGTSTPTLVTATEEGSSDILDGWLDLVSERIEQAVGSPVGAMALREDFVPDDIELARYCEVISSGGSPQCILPSGQRIPIRAGVAWDVGTAVGAVSLYVAPLSIYDHRYWVCLTFRLAVADDLLQAICNSMVAPVTLIVTLEAHDVPESLSPQHGESSSQYFST